MTAHKKGVTVKLHLSSDKSNVLTLTKAHAESLLNLQQEKQLNDWVLPTTSKYVLKDGKLVKRPDTGPVRDTQEQDTDTAL